MHEENISSAPTHVTEEKYNNYMTDNGNRAGGAGGAFLFNGNLSYVSICQASACKAPMNYTLAQLAELYPNHTSGINFGPVAAGSAARLALTVAGLMVPEPVAAVGST